MTGERLVKSRERVKKHAEVYTPAHIVSEMLDMIERECPTAFSDLDMTYLEPTCGNGNFVVQIYERKLKHVKEPRDFERIVKSIYAIDFLPDNVEECIQRVKKILAKAGASDMDNLLRLQIQQGDTLRGIHSDGTPIVFIDWRGDGLPHEFNEEFGGQSFLDWQANRAKQEKKARARLKKKESEQCQEQTFMAI